MNPQGFRVLMTEHLESIISDFLQSIIYRCIFPTVGHIHITDFNIATVLQENYMATSLSGTKAYMGISQIFCVAQIIITFIERSSWL